MARYRIIEEDDGAGCITAAVIGGIIIAVILYLAMYIIGFILSIILFISAVIGSVITLRNYIVALRDSISMCSYCPRPRFWIGPTFTFKWIKVVALSIWGAWGYNLGNIRNFFGSMGYHKFLSFKRWLYFFSGLSVLIFGTLMSIALVVFHLYGFRTASRIAV